MASDFYFIIFQIAVLIFSVMLHEIAHGYVAERLGDPTARYAGRLTLNPLAHIDPLGSIVVPALLIFSHSSIILGWAKPVPYNPNNLYKDYKYGPLKVALAGPATNLFLMLVFGLIIRFGMPILDPNLLGLFVIVALMNAFLAIFNLVPIPPLDGSKLLTILSPRYAMEIERFGMYGIFFVLIFLAFFSRVVFVVAEYLFRLVAGV